MWTFYYLWYRFFYSPMGMFALVLLVLLVCGCVMGIVDFRSKKKPHVPTQGSDDQERDEKLNSIRHYLQEEVTGEFEVSYFDGAYQVFTTTDSELSNEELYRALRIRFPQGVFSMHRTLSHGATVPQASLQPDP